MQRITQGLTEYRIPSYMEEILTHNYCQDFIRMSMVREKDTYNFSYRPGSFERIDVSGMDLHDKLVLLRSVMTIGRRAEHHLIRSDSYLLEPELIYTRDGSVNDRDIRILFYPDIKRLPFDRKLGLFAGRLTDERNREERELLGQFVRTLEEEDTGRGGIFLDRNILRIESGSMHSNK